MFVFAAVITACGGEQATKETEADKAGTKDDKAAKMNGDAGTPAASAVKKSSKMDGVESKEADKAGTTDDKAAKMNGDADAPAASADKKSSKMDGVKSTEAKDAKKEKMTK